MISIMINELKKVDEIIVPRVYEGENISAMITKGMLEKRRMEVTIKLMS